MVERNSRPETEQTAFEINTEEGVYHLELEPDVVNTLIDGGVITPEETCNMCGARAVWYSEEAREESMFKTDELEVTRYWCDNCVPDPFVELWKTWSWTPDEDLERDLSSTTANNGSVGDGLRFQRNIPTVICHLDYEAESKDVVEALDHYQMERDEVTCNDCKHRADWYVADIYDLFRVYDFGAARENDFYCTDCMDPALIDVWRHRPWKPVEKLDSED